MALSPSANTDTAVLFVDMLGFAALLEETPDAVAKLRPIFQPSTPMKSIVESIQAETQGPLVERFTKFHLALEKRILAEVANGITAITFSDSAFLHLPKASRLVAVSRALMRDLIQSRVPARMGIGAGSFAALRFMSDNTPSAHIHSTQFLGTAVVRAYQAEKCGIQGMRAILHPSMRAMVQQHVADGAWVRLPETNPSSYAEVNFLFVDTSRPEVSGFEAIRKRYERYRKVVLEMKAGAPTGKKHYYDNTVKALIRMKGSLVRPSEA